MPDALDAVSVPERRRQLQLIREQYRQVIPSSVLKRDVAGFQSQRGIYKPRDSEYALWIRQTQRRVYPDMPPDVLPDGSWTYRYAPESKGGQVDLSLATNRGLLRCMTDGVPVGVFRQVPRGPAGTSYEVLGLATVEKFDGTHFILRGEPIDWTATPETVVPVFTPFQPTSPAIEEVARTLRDRRFSSIIRRLYQERCSLCSVGYQVLGRSVGLDAAHIIPVEQNGIIADVRNGLLLCKNHHALFDANGWTPDEDLRVRVAPNKEFRRSAEANHILLWEGKKLPNLPRDEVDRPAIEALRWRVDQFDRAWG
jgi:putative restriction endonuclease